jgi:hypothetical protein
MFTVISAEKVPVIAGGGEGLLPDIRRKSHLVICNCRAVHSGCPGGDSGCGAYGELEIQL